MNIQKTMGFSTFSTTKESEIRYEIEKSILMDALQKELIKIKDRIIIEQKWIINQDKCRGRIRKTKLFNSPENSIFNLPFKKYVKIAEQKGMYNSSLDKEEIMSIYEHTVKHSFGRDIDLEVTTVLDMTDFALLDNVYKDTPTQKKTRLVLSDLSGEYDDYIITADIPEDKPEICWIEFESKDGRIHKEFKEPKWISK